MSTATAPFSVADLLHALGDIPPERVRMSPLPGTATETDLLHTPGATCELIDGTLVEKAMGNRESLFAAELVALIRQFVRATDSGVVLGSDGYIRISDEQVRAPDLTYIPWAAFPDEELPEEAYWSAGPGLIIEVLSPGNTDAEIDRKLREFFAAKCQLAWVIDPATKTAKVYTSATAFSELTEAGTLDGGTVLPGFALALKDLFAAPERP
jgi:Uma2 family endonuclease